MAEVTTTQMKKYLTKIRDLLENPTFHLGDRRYLKVVRVDDLICCMEACFPETFKKIIKAKKFSIVESGKYYKNLLAALKAKKGLIFSDCYVVSYRAAITYIEAFSRNIDSDIKKLEESGGSMF